MATIRTITPEARALLDTIAEPESSGRYDVMFGYRPISNLDDHPRQFFPIGNNQFTSAAGRYQFIGDTWDRIAKKHDIQDFSPESQDLAAWYLAQETYSRKTGRDLQTDLQNGEIDKVPTALAGQWASLPGGAQPLLNKNQFLDAFSQNLAVAQAAPTPSPRPDRGGAQPSASGTARALPPLPAPFVFPEMQRSTATTPEEFAAEQAATRQRMDAAFSNPRAPAPLPMSLPGVSGSYSGNAMAQMPTTQGGPINRGRPILNPVAPPSLPSPPQQRVTREGLTIRPVQTVAIDPATGMPRQAAPLPDVPTRMPIAAPLSNPLMESDPAPITVSGSDARRSSWQEGRAGMSRLRDNVAGMDPDLRELATKNIVDINNNSRQTPYNPARSPNVPGMEPGYNPNKTAETLITAPGVIPVAATPPLPGRTAIVPNAPIPSPRPDPRQNRPDRDARTAAPLPVPPMPAPIQAPRPAFRGGVAPVAVPPLPRARPMIAQAPVQRQAPAPQRQNNLLATLLGMGGGSSQPMGLGGLLSGMFAGGQQVARDASGRHIPVGGPMIDGAIFGYNAAGEIGDYGSQPGQITAGLAPGERQYDPATNSWGAIR